MEHEQAVRRQQRRAWIIAVAIIVPGMLFFVTTRFIVRHHHVPTASMSPTIHPGDRILINRLAYKFGGKPQVGDVANYRLDALFIHRIVAGPGDTIQMRDNVLFLNGKRRHEPYIMLTPDIQALRTFGPVTVPPDHYFFMGDNRDNANDSRFMGFVSEDQLRGRLIHVFHIGRCNE
ncbi:MAG TPA: signal peptidase I [Thermoanaerobaculia bacterium]|nr:signal peptidase I [Thermoanaerobaculia bacterium]